MNKIDTRDEKESQAWVKVGDKPIPHGPVLLAWRGVSSPLRGRFVCDERGEGWMNDADVVMPINQHDCTHWMPLPEGPADK